MIAPSIHFSGPIFDILRDYLLRKSIHDFWINFIVLDPPKESPLPIFDGRLRRDWVALGEMLVYSLGVVASFLNLLRSDSYLVAMLGEGLFKSFNSAFVEDFGARFEVLLHHINESVILFLIDTRISDCDCPVLVEGIYKLLGLCHVGGGTLHEGVHTYNREFDRSNYCLLFCV